MRSKTRERSFYRMCCTFEIEKGYCRDYPKLNSLAIANNNLLPASTRDAIAGKLENIPFNMVIAVFAVFCLVDSWGFLPASAKVCTRKVLSTFEVASSKILTGVV